MEDIKIICRSCGNKNVTEKGNDVPADTDHIECNYCPKCEKNHKGDFWEEYFIKNNELITH